MASAGFVDPGLRAEWPWPSPNGSFNLKEMQKRVFLTGASRGLGLAIAEGLLIEGWSVTASARTQGEALANLGQRWPGQLRFLAADFGDPDDVERLATEAGLIEGYDAFVSNAGVGMDGLITLISPDTIQKGIQVNLTAPLLLARACIKGMLERGGSLVFVGSVAAKTGFSGLSAYGATKAGLCGLSRGLAREYGVRGIRSNCVLPGFIATDMSSGLSDLKLAQLRRRTPLGRLGEIQDVVGTILFLISDEARYVSGAEIVVDGGMTA
jgi:3-oxoacyl-[acyl-carrier protein] reductase